jgi:hypothetical protein
MVHNGGDQEVHAMPPTTSLPESLEVPVEVPVPAADAPAPRSELLDVRAWVQERVDGRVCAAVGVAWFVLLELAMALEPATSRAEPLIGVFLELSMWLLLATMVTGLVMQRRFGLVASLGGAVLSTAASIACPISGHHQFGTWWYGQMACMLGLVAVSVFALRRTPTAPAVPVSSGPGGSA